MRTLVGLFEDTNEAKITMDDLKKIGASGDDISILSPEGRSDVGDLHLEPVEVSGIGRLTACGPMTNYLNQSTAANAPDAMAAALVGMGLPRSEAERYVDGVRRGHTLETVLIEDDKADDALAIMRQHALGTGRERGIRENLGTKEQIGKERGVERREAGERVFPVIVEEVAVGKREVGSGGARVETHVEERPIEEKVELREERVDVERRPVDRALSKEEADRAFEEQSVEVRATSEEPVVEKRARVKEEVVLGKEAGTRTETIRETVRETEAEVHQLDREHFDKTYGGRAEDFESYGPAYQFGRGMRTDERFAGREDWSSVEPHARSSWEEKNPGTWDRFKDAVKHAWHRAKS